MRKLVVFSGTHNPPTISTRRLMIAALDQLQARRGTFVLSSDSNVEWGLGESGVEVEETIKTPRLARYAMLKLLMEGEKRVKISAPDFDEEWLGGTVAGLRRLRETKTDAELHFVAEEEKLRDASQWRTLEEIAGFAKIVAFESESFDPRALVEKTPALKRVAEALVVLREPEGFERIDPSEVRRRAENGESIEKFVGSGVAKLFEWFRDHQGAIALFRGKYGFLGNFYHPAPVRFEGLEFANSEAAFQGAKTLDPQLRASFCDLTPSAAKKLGGQVELRPDWEEVKDSVMEAVVRDKFTRHAEFGRLLLETGDRELYEGNSWDDSYWGFDYLKAEGRNQLGRTLMKIRAELAARE
ncbi:MAG: DUF1768 domain-containing protein [Thermoguttaceae bacterium]|nr:DUF1768 domain-containing protein [Thermoguttaceae bacterium]